jgi:ligand-binding sensor domain-containing protein/anti-sigma regulatory factor (Ser/Thr protein kinase)
MLHFRLILLLLLVACFSVRSYGQASQYQLETFGTRNGMLSSKVHALAQTNDRKIWIGTELGISVYDGYSFSNYQYSSANEPIGRILCIAQDHLNGVWVGGDKGLFYFNESSIRKIELQNKTILAVEALLTDGDGNVWLGDINALYKITAQQVENIRTKQLTTVNLSPFASFTKRVFGLAVDNQQNIYTASYDGVFTIKRNAVKYETIWVNPDPYKSVRSVAAISPDSIFWNRLDFHPAQMINGKVQTTFTEDFIGHTVFTNDQKAFALTTSCVGSFSDGVVKPLVLFGNVTNNAITALIDTEENIWVGSWEGLQKFRRTAFQQYSLQHKEQKEIFSFLEKRNEELLFGSNRGLVFTKNQAAIIPHKTIPSLFPLAEVLCMYEHNDGSLWAGSGYQGVSRFKNGKLTNWREAVFLKDNNCEALYTTADGKLFACTENGVTVIEPDAADPMVAHYPLQKKYTRWPELFGCFQTGNSAYWFYGSQGLYKLQKDQLIDDSIQGMPVKSLHINKIIGDNKGNVWVATQGKGLLQCVYKNGKLVLQKQYDSRRGLPSDIALSVLVDKNGNVWLGDFMSLSVLINPGEEEQLITFNEKDGLLSSYYQSLKLEQQRNGTIWGLTSMGMVSFHPDSITFNTLAPVLLISSVIINGAEEKFSASSAQQFSYRHNSFQFNYTAVSLTDPTKIRYAYRLKELDTNWVYTTNRTVDFNFLRPGNYTFELKACNNSNVWTSKPLQYQFTIHPPFWQTWWFRVLLFSIVAVALYLFYKRRINNLKAKAAIKQQMAELEGKAIRAQMNPHFIFNSLNAIQESIVTEKIDVAYDYLSRFSKLLRMVLDNSDKNLIPLSSELETIRLYLSLEALRFSQSFSYTIESNDMLDKEDIYIPSLLLQPFVENAIWHGLINKEGEKLLQIRFSENEGKLQCVIEDNGVGRERAAQIKEQKLGGGRFESKGTKLALQRIEILNRDKPGSATIETIDLWDETGNASGTKVVVTLANDLTPQKNNNHD